MKRQQALVLAALGIMVVIAALAQQKSAPGKLPALEWARKAPAETPPTAVLIEMGFKDVQAKAWDGKATVTGARVVHREGYRFRTGDKLTEPDGWQASSHKPLRSPPNQPAAMAREPFATVGVVLHLSDVQPDATLSLTVKERNIDNEKVPLKDVMAGKKHRIQEGRAVVRLVTTATPVETGKTEDDFPAACYAPDGTLWVAYISYTVKDESRRIEAPPLKGQPEDFKTYYKPEFGDQLFVKSYRAGKWSKPLAVTPDKQDLARCGIAADEQGTIWVGYCANRNGKFNLYVRPIAEAATATGKAPRPGQEVTLLQQHETCVNPAMCTTRSGVALACQTWSAAGPARIAVFQSRNGEWSALGDGFVLKQTCQWYPALASGPQGGLDVACDHYASGDYDVSLGRETEKELTGPKAGDFQAMPLSASSRYEARPSLCYDPQGRLWIAYEEGPEQWGKNFGALDHSGGNPLYFARTVKVVCLDGGKLMTPVAELPPLGKSAGSPETGQQVESMPRYAYPQIGIDGKGRVWLTYRQKFGTRYTTHPGSYWLTFARRLDGDHWTEPIEVHHSDGLLDCRPVLLPHSAGGLRIIHNTDGRLHDAGNHRQPDLHELRRSARRSGRAETGAARSRQEVRQADQGLRGRAGSDPVACRDYRIETGGKKYQLLRGEFHRHTEISWDGGADGSLEDMFRYAIDARGHGLDRQRRPRQRRRPRIPLVADPEVRPTPTTSRTASRRCSPTSAAWRIRTAIATACSPSAASCTLPRLAEPDMKKRVGGVHADDTKMLYRYLHELDGICASHTSATSMGTDWRDNDPVVEPIVEIYQGDRMSYEKQAAPRAGYDPKSGKKPANIAGWYPEGLHQPRPGQGLPARLPVVQRSLVSTHISYCIVLAESHDREGILDGLKKRHCYGATDNIVLDVRSGEHLMGDELKTNQPPTLEIKVIGTGPLAKVDVLKDSTVVRTFEPGKSEFQGKWTDPKPSAGMHYYYVRVQQADGELAWGSPLWIDYVK